MERERKIAMVTDSGCSVRAGSPEARNLNVTIVPLEIKFWEKGQYVPYSDADIQTEDFYQRMLLSEKLPETSGALPGQFLKTYRDLREKAESIVSVHISSKLSGVWESATAAKNIVQEEPGPEIEIEVIDSKVCSLATWFPIEAGGKAIIAGADLGQVRDEVKNVIDNTELRVTLESFENLKKGGRGKDILQAILATKLSLFPVIAFKDGGLRNAAMTRLKPENARQRMIEMVGDAGKLVRLAVIHTKSADIARRMKEELQNRKIFNGEIPVYEAGPVLAVHAGAGAIAFAFQKA